MIDFEEERRRIAREGLERSAIADVAADKITPDEYHTREIVASKGWRYAISYAIGEFVTLAFAIWLVAVIAGALWRSIAGHPRIVIAVLAMEIGWVVARAPDIMKKAHRS